MLEKQCYMNDMVKMQIVRMDDNTLDWKYDIDSKIYANKQIYKDAKGRKYFKAYGRHYIDEFKSCDV